MSGKVQRRRHYISHPPALPCRSDEDVERYRKLREIHVEGTGVPKPVASFEEASFPGAALPPLLESFPCLWSLRALHRRVASLVA